MHGAIGMSSAPRVADARRAISRLVGIHDFKPPATPEVSDSRKSAGYGDCRRSSSHDSSGLQAMEVTLLESRLWMAGVGSESVFGEPRRFSYNVRQAVILPIGSCVEWPA